MARQPARHRIRQAGQDLREKFARTQDKDIFLGFLGRGDSNKTVLVPDRPGFVYVRIPKKVVTGTLEEYTEAIAYSPNEQRYNTSVKMAKMDSNPAYYEVIDGWPISLGGLTTVQTTQPQVGIHHMKHELFSTYGGDDPVMLDTLQMRNLQIRPTSPPSSKIVIDNGWYIWKDGEVHWFDKVEVELASYVPTGTFTKTFANIWLDPDDNSVYIKPNTAVGTALPLSSDDSRNYIEWPDEDYIPLGCVILRGGNYRVEWSTDKDQNFYDMRVRSMMPKNYPVNGHPLDPSEGYHTGSLQGVYVSISDPSGTFTYDNVQNILLDEIAPNQNKVKVSSNDTTTNYLENKIVAGANITITVLNEGGNETLSIESSGGGGTSSGGGGNPFWYIDGALTTYENVWSSYIMTSTGTISYAYIHCKDTGTSGNTIVDINKNGTSIFTNQANRPTLAYDDVDKIAKSGIPDVVDLDENDILTVDIDEFAPGADSLTIVLALSTGETVSIHNDLDGLQGGNTLPTGSFYHLDVEEYYSWHNFVEAGNQLPSSSGTLNQALIAQGDGVIIWDTPVASLTKTIYGIEITTTDMPEEGRTRNATTSGSYTSQQIQVTASGAFLLEYLKWDLKANTYTLSVNGIDIDTKIIAGDTDNYLWTLPTPILFAPGESKLLKVTCASQTWWDYSSSGSGVFTYWSTTGGAGYSTSRTAPVLLGGKLGQWTIIE